MTNKNITKKIELALVLFLLVFAFFAGVSYSDAIKNHASWLFEPKEEEVELPDLSNEKPGDAVIIDDNGENVDNKNNQDSVPVNNEAQPSEPNQAPAN